MQIIVNNQIFKYEDVKLPISAPRPGKALIGFDRSFMKNRTTSSDIDLFQFIKILYPDTIKHSKTDFYIPSIDLYIDNRLYKYNNFSAFYKDKFITNCLNELIMSNDIDFIEQWCINDVNKRNSINSKYLEIFEYINQDDLQNQIKRAAFGLEYKYQEDDLKKEILLFENDKNKILFDKNIISNKLTLHFQPHFYREENNLYKTNFTWRRKLIDNCKAFLYKKEFELNDKEILRQIKIAGLHDGFSHHSPHWIMSFINKYNIKTLADPTGGWGQRLIGAAIKNLDLYIYNDIDPDTTKGAYNIAKFMNYSNVVFYSKDAANFTPKQEYEAVYTCPPYFTTELYFGSNTSTKTHPDYNSWLNIWWNNVVKSWMKPTTKYFAFCINNQYKNDMTNICYKHNLKLIDEIQVGKSTNKNHFQRTAKNSFKGEQILVFTHC